MKLQVQAWLFSIPTPVSPSMGKEPAPAKAGVRAYPELAEGMSHRQSSRRQGNPDVRKYILFPHSVIYPQTASTDSGTLISTSTMPNLGGNSG